MSIIETVADYWNARPCNIRHSPKPVGTKEYFDEVEKRKYFVEPHIPDFADFPHWKGKKVLEIGCGIGTDTINFARHGAHVTAVDLSKRSLDLAAQRAKVYGLEGQIRFFNGNAEELASFLPLETYDLIYAFGVMHHTANPEKTLEQIRSFAHPKTVIKIMVYHRFSWKVIWILLTYAKGRFWRLKEYIARYSEAQAGCPVTHTYTRNEIRNLLSRYGFVATKISINHIFPYKISDYRQYRYIKVWYFRWLPRPIFRWLEKCFGWHLCVTAVPDEKKDSLNAKSN